MIQTILKPTPPSAGTIYLALEQWLLMKNQWRVRVFAIRVLRRLFIPVREEVKEGWKKLSDQAFIISVPRQIFLG